MVNGVTSQALDLFYKFGKDARLVGVSTDLASMSIRAPLTLFDKKADKETRTHAALWQAVDYGSAITVELALFPLLPKIGKFLAEKVLQYKNPQAISGAVKFTNFFVGYFLMTSVLLPLLNTKYLTKIINHISEKRTGKKYMPHAEEDEAKQNQKKEEFKQKVKSKINSASENIFGKTITSGFKLLASGINKSVAFTLKPLDYVADTLAQGLSFGVIGIADKLNKLFKGKSISSDKDKLENQTAKVLKKAILTGLSLIPLALISQKFGPALGNKLEKFFIKENNVSASSMIIRCLTGDALAKPMIIMLNGAPYMALRKFMDQMISVSMLKVSRPLIGNLTESLGTSMKLDPIKKEGLSTLLTTVIQTVFMLNILLPTINNQIAGRLFNKIFKDKNNKPDSVKNEPSQTCQNPKPYQNNNLKPLTNFDLFVMQRNNSTNKKNIFDNFERQLKTATR